MVGNDAPRVLETSTHSHAHRHARLTRTHTHSPEPATSGLHVLLLPFTFLLESQWGQVGALCPFTDEETETEEDRLPQSGELDVRS